jgi:tRNA(adenine34) deaminase
MELALKEARLAKERDEVPVGAVIIDKNNNILASNGNRVIELSDPTAHAEILCIREATRKIKNERLIDCTIFSTLEPCTMCSSAISLARIKKLFFGAYDHKNGAVESCIKYFQTSSCNHKPEF